MKCVSFYLQPPSLTILRVLSYAEKFNQPNPATANGDNIYRYCEPGIGSSYNPIEILN